MRPPSFAPPGKLARRSRLFPSNLFQSHIATSSGTLRPGGVMLSDEQGVLSFGSCVSFPLLFSREGQIPNTCRPLHVINQGKTLLLLLLSKVQKDVQQGCAVHCVHKKKKRLESIERVGVRDPDQPANTNRPEVGTGQTQCESHNAGRFGERIGCARVIAWMIPPSRAWLWKHMLLHNTYMAGCQKNAMHARGITHDFATPI
ncbi:hypothetical protein LY76DRAFT_117851 [Colletotrichum caudatum]|nr:hypothetical protein LY76DRAFT_117851 [Colletotrichum caudatum]